MATKTDIAGLATTKMLEDQLKTLVTKTDAAQLTADVGKLNQAIGIPIGSPTTTAASEKLKPIVDSSGKIISFQIVP